MKAYSITVLKRLFKYFATRKVNSNQQELPQNPHVFGHLSFIYSTSVAHLSINDEQGGSNILNHSLSAHSESFKSK